MLIETQNNPRRQVQVPFLRQPLMLGDAVRTVTQAVGLPHCSPCEERRLRFNQMLEFVPRREQWR
jgi:hypothetical protein